MATEMISADSQNLTSQWCQVGRALREPANARRQDSRKPLNGSTLTPVSATVECQPVHRYQIGWLTEPGPSSSSEPER